LDILGKHYKKFVQTHHIDQDTQDILRKDILDTINEDIFEPRFSIALYALIIIQETNKSIDQVFLQEEIYRRNDKFQDNPSIYMGFKRKEIAKVLQDPFIQQQMTNRSKL